eukprot:CAMPEP_0172481212 /NCGR_PEP_ID=MMETSP1066-20121228/6891_1 /TAXON_ID=671091 /ORGANISM="Coscinodiscus wailesii, Strain CCMP2513" /LENGTH=269 /DNA_ID=CAMNT_0013243261 /DNA_START=204 /DNA_END=1013 /DNA_ORIENTATION=+
MEALSNNNIKQNSCLRPSSTLKGFLEYGNGMETIWRTENALNDNGEYDIGARNVTALLYGDNRHNAPQWDYVVMNDRSHNPAQNKTRQISLNVLQKGYAPMLANIGATPVFIATHAYRNNTNITATLGDVPTYTARVKQGYEQYSQTLSQLLPTSHTPLIAPVGDAFLIVWRENLNLWYKLYNTDGLHPSPHGTYLQGCVIYCTIYGKAPLKSMALPKDVSVMFRNARAMQPDGLTPGGDYLPYPNYEEALYLYDVAVRVVLLDYETGS